MDIFIFVLDVASVIVFTLLAFEYFVSGVRLKQVAMGEETSAKEIAHSIYKSHHKDYLDRWQNKAIIVFFVIVGLFNAISGDIIIAVSSLLVSSSRHYSLLWAEGVRELTEHLIKN